MTQNAVRIDWATSKIVESLFLLFLFPLSVPALLYPSLHFGIPFSQYITYQGLQYLILKRKAIHYMLGERNLSSAFLFGRKWTCLNIPPLVYRDVQKEIAQSCK